MHEFSNKPWSASGLDKLIKKIDDRGGMSTDLTNLVFGILYSCNIRHINTICVASLQKGLHVAKKIE